MKGSVAWHVHRRRPMSKIHTRGRAAKRAGAATPKAKATKTTKTQTKAATAKPPPGGALIGRRVGRSSKDLGDALKRPEKLHGDYPVDTAKKGVSATARKAGGGSTARRNSRKNATGASYTLEDSATGTPSRKSTRRSANHQKPDSNLKRRQTRETTSPEARAGRAIAKGTKTRGSSGTSPRV
jgi:hypothetical protein